MITEQQIAAMDTETLWHRRQMLAECLQIYTTPASRASKGYSDTHQQSKMILAEIERRN